MTTAARTEIEANQTLRLLAEARRRPVNGDPVAARCRGGRLLVDIGCGSGAFLERIRDRYDAVAGIDFIPLQSPRFENVYVIRADLRDGLPLADASADTLTAIELIEHIADPAHLVREAFRVARPGAELVLTTPNVRYVRHLFRLVAQGRGPRTSGARHDDILWDGGHIHYFTAEDVTALLRGAGFVSVQASALIGPNGFLPSVRKLLFRWKNSPVVREFFTGRLIVTARKPGDEAP